MPLSAMSQQFRIMTYNVHSCIGTDSKASTERIAEVIFRSDADIVALQEIDTGLARTGLADQAREISSILEMQFHFHPSLHMEEGTYGNALLSRFPLRLMRGGSLPTLRGLRNFERRGALWAEVLLPERNIHVVTSHFGLVRRERLVQVQEILGRQWLAHPYCRPPVILCGDFNASPFSLVYHRITSRLRDVQRAVAGWRARKTWPSRFPVVRIDHIFVSPDFTVDQVDVVQDGLTRRASDHLPLMATLRLAGPGARETDS